MPSCRRLSRIVIIGCVLALPVGGLISARCPAADGVPDAREPAIDDVVRAIDAMRGEATLLTFAGAGVDVPHGGHLQGAQMRFYPTANRHVLFLSHDSDTAGYLLAVEFVGDLSAPGRVIHVLRFPSDGAAPPLRHAGGFQLSGDVLAIGLEDNQQKTRSQVQFWDVADPTHPRPLEHLTIGRSGEPEDQTAGGVALVRRKFDHLAAVANWDSRAIDFYASDDKPLADSACRFHQLGRWQVAGADTSHWRPDHDVAEYQAINLLVDTVGRTYLVGFATTGIGQDVVDLFAVDVDAPPARILQKISRKPLRPAGGAHFRNAAGLWIDRGRPAILASPRNLTPETRISLSR